MQSFEQLPQVAGSSRFLQVPPQHAWPAAHGAPLPQAQAPAVHRSDAAPHEVQFAPHLATSSDSAPWHVPESSPLTHACCPTVHCVPSLDTQATISPLVQATTVTMNCRVAVFACWSVTATVSDAPVVAAVSGKPLNTPDVAST